MRKTEAVGTLSSSYGIGGEAVECAKFNLLLKEIITQLL